MGTCTADSVSRAPRDETNGITVIVINHTGISFVYPPGGNNIDECKDYERRFCVSHTLILVRYYRPYRPRLNLSVIWF